MKKLLSILLAVSLFLGVVTGVAFAAPKFDPLPSGSGGNSVYYMYDSLIDVTVTATDLGDGSWQYDFSFTNTDVSEIWHFFVWAPEALSDADGSFPEFDDGHSLDSIDTEYDARNLNASLMWVDHMWYEPFATTGLAVGDSASLSFVGDFFTATFLFGYETVASGHAVNNGGYVAAIGYAIVPEPATLLLLGAGLVGIGLVRRRIKS